MNHTAVPDEHDRTAIERLVQALETAWNAGDGVAFGATMTDNADFVTIRAEHFIGRDVIAAGHAEIFRTVFLGSTIRDTVDTARLLTPDLALVHVRSALDVPAGPLAGRHDALFSGELVRETKKWVIDAFHNTLAPRAPR